MAHETTGGDITSTRPTTLIGISGRIGSGKDTLANLILQSILDFHYYQEFLPYIEEELIITANQRTNNWCDFTDWSIKKFADKLKDMVCLLIGCTREQLEDQYFKSSLLPPEWDTIWMPGFMDNSWVLYKGDLNNLPYHHKRTPTSVREMLQRVGTDCMRDHLHPNTWVNALFSTYKPTIDSSDGVAREKFPKWIITDMRFPNEFEAVKARGGICIRISAGAGSAYRFQYKDGTRMAISQEIGEHESETALDHEQNWDEYIKNTGSLSDLYEIAKSIVTKYKLA